MLLQQTPVSPLGQGEQVFHLDFPLNMTNIAFSTEELRAVLQQVMPCDIRFAISQDDFNGSGRGIYMKDSRTRIVTGSR